MSHNFLAGHRGEVRKIRRPRSERIPKSEGPKAALAPRTFCWALAAAACSAGGQNLRGEPVRVSGVGFLSDFGFRASDFKGGEVSKIRRPKAEIRKNSEVRGPEDSVGPSDGLLGTGRSRVFRRWPKPARRAGSGFGHRISFGFRISRFGFQTSGP